MVRPLGVRYSQLSIHLKRNELTNSSIIIYSSYNSRYWWTLVTDQEEVRLLSVLQCRHSDEALYYGSFYVLAWSHYQAAPRSRWSRILPPRHRWSWFPRPWPVPWMAALVSGRSIVRSQTNGATICQIIDNGRRNWQQPCWHRFGYPDTFKPFLIGFAGL